MDAIDLGEWLVGGGANKGVVVLLCIAQYLYLYSGTDGLGLARI